MAATVENSMAVKNFKTELIYDPAIIVSISLK
jgi:hypothetical protein